MNVFHLLTLIFVIAQITGYITWSWWLVFLPSIVSVCLFIAAFLAIAAAADNRPRY
jgi:uncharacterized membrane protein YedE/YeeE